MEHRVPNPSAIRMAIAFDTIQCKRQRRCVAAFGSPLWHLARTHGIGPIACVYQQRAYRYAIHDDDDDDDYDEDDERYACG